MQPEKPHAVTRGTLLLYAGLIPGIIPLIRNDLPPNPSLPWWFGAAVGSTTLLLLGTLAFLASRRHNWARVALLVTFALGIPVVVALPSDLSTWLAARPADLARIGVQTSLQVAGLLYLFSRSASRWFRERHDA
jgi:hypothetical protein